MAGFQIAHGTVGHVVLQKGLWVNWLSASSCGSRRKKKVDGCVLCKCCFCLVTVAFTAIVIAVVVDTILAGTGIVEHDHRGKQCLVPMPTISQQYVLPITAEYDNRGA